MRNGWMKTLAALLLAAPLWVAGARSAHADPKIGYVDLQSAVGATTDGLAARKHLKEIFDEKQKQLDEAQNGFKAAEEDLDRQRSVLRPDAVKAKEAELQKQYVDLQSTYMQLQKEISDKEQELTRPILVKMQKLVGQIAHDEGFTMVVDKQVVLWTPDDAADLTKELVRRYNAGK